MPHIKPISRTPRAAEIDPLEEIIMILLGLFFSDWENYPEVAQNLQKYYQKTP